jgi:hypothetical protein
MWALQIRPTRSVVALAVAVFVAPTLAAGCTDPISPSPSSPSVSTAGSTGVVASSGSTGTSPTTATNTAAGITTPSRGISASTSSPTSSSPVIFDAATATWFSAVCTGQKDLEKYASPSTTGTLDQAKATIAGAYTNLSRSASRTAVLLAGLKAPAVPDGATSKRLRIALFQAVAKGYGDGATSIAAAKPASAGDLKKAVDKVEATVKASVTAATAGAAALPPADQDAVKKLPACAGVRG